MSKRKPAPSAAVQPESEPEIKPAKKAAFSRAKPQDHVIELGAMPRANLLPPEIKTAEKQRATQRALWLGVAGVVLVVIASSVGAALLSVASAVNLTLAQQQSAALVVEQSKHAEVRDIKSNVALAEAALEVGASTEIDLKTYLLGMQATLPAGVAIATIETSGATPIADFAQSDTPLEGYRVGTLAFTATSPTLPSIPQWLDGLATLDGFVDAVPNSVTLDEQGGYLVTMTMHIDQGAYSGRFSKQEESE
jgi:Tfp pilus assembly protein PilN